MAGVKPGVTYTNKQLFYGMMLPSGNDAARALAHSNGGIKETIAQMNEVAASIGALDTVAKTPNGLDKKGQHSSAFDLALIAMHGLQNPEFATIVRAKKAPFPSEGGGTHPIYTNNHLLLGGYKGCIGVKTGFTTEAGRTFIGAATHYKCIHCFSECRNKFFRNTFLNKDAICRSACRTTVTHLGQNNSRNCFFNICIIKHDYRCISTKFH